MAPVFQRIANRLSEMVDMGWKPATDIADPILWRRRCRITLADYLCYFTMDATRSWQKVWPCSHVSHGTHSILVFSDGGTREGDCSASAWVMGAILDNGHGWAIRMIAAEGQFLHEPASSFQAETVALDRGIQHVRKYMRKHPT